MNYRFNIINFLNLLYLKNNLRIIKNIFIVFFCIILKKILKIIETYLLLLNLLIFAHNLIILNVKFKLHLIIL